MNYKFKDRVKILLQFVKYVIFSRNSFNVSFFKRCYFAICGGFNANQCALYSLNKDNKEDYLSEKDWFKSRLVNKPYDRFINDKILFNELIRPYINTPKVYMANYQGVITVNPDWEFDNAFRNELTAIMKPIFAGKGNCVYKVSFKKDESIYVDNVCYDQDRFQSFINGFDNWMLVEYINQSEYSARIYPDTLNTVRIVMVRIPETQKFEMAYAVHRFGRLGTNNVDNASKGGLVSKINLTTGELSEAKSLISLSSYQSHPDTQCLIQGCVIPDWKNIVQKIYTLSEHFNYLKLIAWDIAITKNGDVCVIEGNSSSGVNILQLWGGQRNQKLGIFLKKCGVIK